VAREIIESLFKRSFDILASLTGLIISLPLQISVALLIRVKSPGPAIFRQIRSGRNSRPFTLYKFRSMFLDHGGNSVSVKGESRITPLGIKLRKYKLDELPELWNILKGDMSFVGPRPDMPEYAARLKGEERKILELRPGLTGPATLKYANEEEILATVPDPVKYNDEVIWPDKVRINLEYYYNRSFWGDISIILRTVFRRK
jgi:lipopolysaccharide/colanic/teichoic acid biosynthesis glycosyltransferase